jgi:hypothetical protein
MSCKKFSCSLVNWMELGLPLFYHSSMIGWGCDKWKMCAK